MLFNCRPMHCLIIKLSAGLDLEIHSLFLEYDFQGSIDMVTDCVYRRTFRETQQKSD